MPKKAKRTRFSKEKSNGRARVHNGAPVKARSAGRGETPARTEAPDYAGLLKNLDRVVPHALALVISTLPRGGLGIVQPPRVHEVIMRAYSRQFHTEDRLTWQTVIGGQTLVDGGVDAAAFGSTAYASEFMRVHGLEHVVTAPVADPVFPGYPGALHIYRTAGQGAFTAAHADAVRALAKRLGDLAANVRARRCREASRQPPHWLHTPAVRQFAFDSNLKPLLWPDSFADMDKALLEHMLEEASRRLKGDDTDGRAVGLTDSAGERWMYQSVKYPSYPALADGPVVFFCMQPNRPDWDAVRATDFDADTEMVQLAAALPYMRQHFARHPTLAAISRTANVSPFHFHRRFTLLMGITPKHFLLECQIYEARRLLAERRMDLPDLARECGFAHQSHFTSRFKQVIGMTPTHWRRFARQKEMAVAE